MPQDCRYRVLVFCTIYMTDSWYLVLSTDGLVDWWTGG